MMNCLRESVGVQLRKEGGDIFPVFLPQLQGGCSSREVRSSWVREFEKTFRETEAGGMLGGPALLQGVYDCYKILINLI